MTPKERFSEQKYEDQTHDGAIVTIKNFTVMLELHKSSPSAAPRPAARARTMDQGSGPPLIPAPVE